MLSKHKHIILILAILVSSQLIPPVQADEVKTIGVPWEFQHKDTPMLCLQGCDYSGDDAWDSSHLDHNIHGDAYCVRASIAMIANYFNNKQIDGGRLSQDRITYHMTEENGLGPEYDLKHSESAGPDEALAWALGIEPENLLVYTFGYKFMDTTELLDDKRVILGAWDGHARVIDGYKISSTRYFHILDPWSLTEPSEEDKWVPSSSVPTYAVFLVTPAVAPGVRQDEESIWSDSDGDGICDFDEVNRFFTDPLDVDSDSDGIEDKAEILSYTYDYEGRFGPGYFYDYMEQKLAQDYPVTVGGLPVALYFLRGNNPLFPYTKYDFATGVDIGWHLNQPLIDLIELRSDMDGDSLRVELDRDSDGDGLLDRAEDKNGNGVFEWWLGETNPLIWDTKPPTTIQSVNPDYYESGSTNYVTSSTLHTLKTKDDRRSQRDIDNGITNRYNEINTGIEYTRYRYYPADSEDPLPDYSQYSGPFTITGDPGEYVIEFYSMDKHGNIEAVKTVHETLSDIASLQLDNVYFEGLEYYFTPTDVVPDTYTLKWSFGSIIKTGKTTSYTFPSNGLITIKIDEFEGSTPKKSQSFTALVLDTSPVADYSTAGPYYEGSPVQFTDTSSPGNDDIVAWSWDFDDAGKSMVQNPVHAFKNDGVYRVTLTVTDSDGSSSSIFKEITILNKSPVATISPVTDAREGNAIEFQLSILDPGIYDLQTIHWDFGDDNIPTGYGEEDYDLLRPVHIYHQEGEYVVTVSVSDGDGGTDIDTITVNVENVAATTTPGNDGQKDEGSATISFENGKIAFQSDRDGNSEIYIMNPDGTNQTRLTNNKYKEEHPAWSPYGNRIAFTSIRNNNEDIYIMNADGTDETRLTYNSAKDYRPNISPDGLKIAFASTRDGKTEEIYVMNTDGSEQTRLTKNNYEDTSPVWSHDGKKILFESNRDGNYEIYIMNPDGTGQTRLTINSYDDVFANWSPDDSKIVFTSNREGYNDIYTMNADGSDQTKLTSDKEYDEVPSWSPDGTKIAFVSYRDGVGNIYIMNPDGSEQTKLTNNVVGGEGDWWPVWQSIIKVTVEPKINGKISFTSDRDGNYEIYTMNADGSEQTRLTNNKYTDIWPTYSPDGKKILFSSDRDGNLEIYIMNIDGSEQTRLTNNNFEDIQPCLSPDAEQIAFTSTRDGKQEIYLMNIDGSGLTMLTNNDVGDDLPRWSPDGSKIVFESKRDGYWEIYLMNADGSEQTRLTYNHDENPCWSPDGSKIVFTSPRDGNEEIYIMNPDGSGHKRLMGSSESDYLPFWSPDGTKIAFISTRDGDNEIFVMNIDGTEQTKLTDNIYSDYFPSWQSLSKLDSTLALSSSTMDTYVDSDFIIDGTLSAPKSGTVTLYWSIDSPDFTNANNVTMTDGKISRVFTADSAGTWSFKLVWVGDDEYKRVESNTVTVVVKPTPAISVTCDANPSQIISGADSVVTVNLSSEGLDLSGATVNLASNNGGTFSPIVDHGDGSYTATYISPDTASQISCVITASAEKAGYIGASVTTQITVEPLTLSIYTQTSDDKPVFGSSLVSTSQPNGQQPLSGSTDENGLVSFTGLLKGSYTFAATKSGYKDETITFEVKSGQATTETITMTAKPSGIPGYPLTSIIIAVISLMTLYKGKHTYRARIQSLQN